MKPDRFLLAAPLVLLALGACSPDAKTVTGRSAAAETPEGIGRLAVAYHGMLLDGEHRELEVDLPVIAKWQEEMIRDLRAASDEETRARVDSLDTELAQVKELQQGDRILANHAVAGLLLQKATEKIHAVYEWRYRTLRTRSWHLLDESGFQIDPAILELLRRWDLIDYVFPQPGSSEYLADCRAHQVPIPPDWDAGWTFRGDLEERFNFIGSGKTEVYTYHDDDGVCYALPRSSSGLMGIICQSKRTGKACFWDNINASTGARVDWRTQRVVIADLQNGSNLDENCTQCHRGDNAFLIHPASALRTPLDTDPEVRYTPIGQSTWSNPGPLTLPAPSAGGGSCAGCHEVPEPSPAYCRVLREAALNSMPPGAPAGWPAPMGSRYKTHIDFLMTRCPGV